jgi:hypothetical protein
MTSDMGAPVPGNTPPDEAKESSVGEQSEFICPKCRYTAVVAGGFDCGFESAFMTIVCLDCEELYDALADQKPDELLRDSVRTELGDQADENGESDFDVSPTGLTCPKDAKHGIAWWEFPGGCPKCGTQMGRGRPCPRWD